MYDPDRLHAVRIAFKKLRYALELSHAEAAAETLEVLRRAQVRLGHLHDVQDLLTHVIAAAADQGRTTLGAGIAQIAGDLERECRGIHAAFIRDVPMLDTAVAALRRRGRAFAHGPRLRMAKAHGTTFIGTLVRAGAGPWQALRPR
jgi:CHAD domain-containing protein